LEDQPHNEAGGEDVGSGKRDANTLVEWLIELIG
jgi:hypothetical protein